MKFNKALFILVMCFLILTSNNVTYASIDNTEVDEIDPNASSSTVVYNDYEYLKVSGGVYIIGYYGSEEELSIPSTLNGYTVTGLYSECFAGAPNLKKVIIPSTVNSIYTDTFVNCSTLETIEVSSSNSTYASYDGMLYSKDYVYFVTCPEGKSGAVSIKSGTEYICDNSFFNASKVTSIYIPSSVYDIGSTAFYGTSSLSSFSVSSSNKYFTYSDGILYDKSKTEVIKCVDKRVNCITIASTVKTIRDYAFFGCENLVGPINLPSGITSIGEGAFSNCKSLSGDIVLPSNLTEIGAMAFYNCNSISSLTISSNITNIPDDCFAYCTSLKEIIIPNNIKEIGERAFFYCINVETLNLGSGLNKIGNWAFDYFKSLKGNLVIPDSVTSIGDSAFQHSPLIDGYIIIGSNVSEIGVSVFYDSQNSKGIIFRGSVPTISDYTFKEPSVTYYYLEGKTGFEESIKNKTLKTYAEKPVVSFIVNGQNYKTVNLSTYGLTVEEFSNPEIENYIFNGWYYDENYTNEYNFSDIIMDNTNIYANLEEINEINFNLSELLLEVGQTKKVEYSYILESGATTSDILWQSSNEEVATVDENGNITALSKGETIISATYKNAYAEMVLTVFKDENEISFSDEQIRIVIGSEEELGINYHLLNNATYDDIVWTTSDENVATVSGGKVKAISEGTAIITASYEDVQDVIEVNVVRNNELNITTSDFFIKQDKNQKIDVEYYFNDDATSDDIVWSSSNTSIATVNNGVVTAKSAGEVTIIASYKDVQDSIKVTVVNKDSIFFESDSLNIENTLETYNLVYSFYSYDYDIEDIIWSSSNTQVATVENGVLTIGENGQTIVTAMIGDAIESVVINVVDKNKLEFCDDSIEVGYRKNTDINFNIDYYFNDGGTLDDIIYESSNSSVVRIINNELVVSGIGKTTIKATYKDVSDTIEVEVVSIDKLSFKRAGYIIGIGNAQEIEYTFDSYEGDYQNIVFSSSNTNVAKVQNGNIVAVGYGEAKIIASYKNMTAEVKVIVTDDNYLLGDLDFNGVVNANDAAVALDIYKYNNQTDIQRIVGDLDFNGVINANDAALILDIYKYGK